MAVTWPATLPTAQRNGHGHNKGVATSRLRFAAGNSRAINQTTTPPTLFSLTWVMNQAQLDALIAFWEGAGDLGAADINGITYIDSSGLVTSGSNGAPSLRFVGAYQAPRIGLDLYRVSAQLESITDDIGSASDYFSGTPLLWEDGTPILWDDSTEIHWD